MRVDPLLAKYKGGGAGSYHPKMMLKVSVYGYSQKIWSSRRLARAVCENIHFMWLAGGKTPDFLGRSILSQFVESLEGQTPLVAENPFQDTGEGGGMPCLIPG